ncbi:AAA family ATPase [Streptococcus suis]|uniref:AAA family ATPase n=1 Tax=Streptococcus suis TaxID=1307 RepID=UPI000C1A0C85|nr:AAA family ATPase [Streptococcus suis]
MKITRFTIKALHGFFDYNVELNEDITFLFGENGSGKTTVLSMLDHVVSGEIYKLFNYEFKNITVYFKEKAISYSEDSENRVEVRLKKARRKSGKQLIVDFKEKKETISYDRDYTSEIDFLESSFEIKRRFFDSYKLVEEIKNCFNYLFLPLNRLNYQMKDFDNREFRLLRNKLAHNSDLSFNNSESMHSVEQLLGRSVSQINSGINKLNENMRQDILKSALEMSKDDLDLSEFFKYFAKDDLVSELEDTKKRYIKLLEDLKAITTINQKEEYNQYFSNLISQVEKSVATNETDTKRTLPAQLIGTYVELIRIKKLIKIYEDIEEKILELKTPINDFLKYTNKFLKDGKDEKEIIVNSLGEVFFVTNYTSEPVRLKYLSSGEKQIVTLISNLIFKVDKSKFTIFIVDEPELSLHLSWQKKIVANIHEINRNMQLIFATHSPEIIGKYDSKAIELEKHYKPVEKFKDSIDEEEIEELADFIFGIDNKL